MKSNVTVGHWGRDPETMMVGRVGVILSNVNEQETNEHHSTRNTIV